MKNVEITEFNPDFKPLTVKFTIETKEEYNELLEFADSSEHFAQLDACLNRFKTRKPATQ
jgi:hypothetical protein